jgi:hypothetical protein
MTHLIAREIVYGRRVPSLGMEGIYAQAIAVTGRGQPINTGKVIIWSGDRKNGRYSL